MTSTDMVSVVVPIYNVEKFLKKCVTSIMRQSYEQLEIILVDDGSTDNCGLICEQLKAADHRIRVIHQSNRGLSAARNIGISAARGEYIMLIDGDDYIVPEMAERMLSRIKEDNTDIVICPYQYADEQGNPIREDLMAYCELRDEVLSRNDLLGKINFNVRGYWFYSSPCTKLYRSCYLKALKYPENRLFEDEFMAHHLFGSINSASVMSECFYLRTQRAGSITDTCGYESLKRMDVVLALEDRYRYFRKNKYCNYARDTAGLLNTVFRKIVKNAFRERKDYLKYLGKMAKISFILLFEFKKSGFKLPIIYFRSFMKLSRGRSGT